MPDADLAHVIVLRDGATLRTIGDATALIEERSKSIVPGTLKYLLLILLRAIESGGRADIAKATEQLEQVLHYAGLLQRTSTRREG